MSAASFEVSVVVDGGAGFPEFLFVQASPSGLGVADALCDACAASRAVIATWANLAVFPGVLALWASVSVPVIVKVGLIDA